MHSRNYLRVIVSTIFLTVLTGDFALTKPNSRNELITEICLSQLSEEMKNAGKNPPPGMATFTCKCFYMKLNQGFSIPSAKSLCQEKASKKYRLEKIN